MHFLGELIGFLAGIATATCFLPQSIKTIKTRDTKDLSLGSYIIYCTGMILWTLYGVYLHSLPMMIFNGISLVFSGSILYIIIRNNLGGKKS